MPENGMRMPPRDNLFRAVYPSVELRANEDDAAGPPVLAGHFSVFNEWTEIDSVWEGRFLERIAPGAFSDTFNDNRDRIRVLFQHGQDPQVGDKPLGPIQTLEEDETGARYEVPLLDTSYNREIIPGLQAGLYGSSFRFNVVDEQVVKSPKRSSYNPEGLPERTVRKAHVFEFGPVTFPAYAGATAGVRSLTDRFNRETFGSAASSDTRPERSSDDGSQPERLGSPLPTVAQWGAQLTKTFSDATDQEITVPNMTVEERAARQTEIKARQAELDQVYAGEAFPDEIRAEWDQLKKEFADNERVLADVAERRSYLQSVEESRPASVARGFEPPQTLIRKNDDIFDLAKIRMTARSDDEQRLLLADSAKRAVEIAPLPSVDSAQVDSVKNHITNLLAQDDDRGTIARRILSTGSPVYSKAFGKTLAGEYLTSEESRAMSLTGAAGGFAVPFTLDPTILGTSNGVVNPLRQIARVVQITTDEWRGISSGAVTASYAAEATETTDNSPTLAQPTISTERAQAFIPFSIEIGMDWPALQAEMGNLLQEAKDDLEASKFTTGTGTNEPFGLITGATNTVNATAGGVFDVGDLYALQGALPPRYQPRAAFAGNLAIFNTVRQFDTAGGANLWTNLGNGTPERLLGKPAYEMSSMAAVTTVGARFLVYGDFSRFVIVDRIGLDIELIPHLLGANRRPTGERGLYAYWRNGSKVVDANAFRVLLGLA